MDGDVTCGCRISQEMSRSASDLLIDREAGRWFDNIKHEQEGNMFEEEDDIESKSARRAGECMSEAEIDYNVMGSFPASDPPSWTLGISRRKTSCGEFEGEKPSVHDPSHQNEPPHP